MELVVNIIQFTLLTTIQVVVHGFVKVKMIIIWVNLIYMNLAVVVQKSLTICPTLPPQIHLLSQ